MVVVARGHQWAAAGGHWAAVAGWGWAGEPAKAHGDNDGGFAAGCSWLLRCAKLSASIYKTFCTGVWSGEQFG